MVIDSSALVAILLDEPEAEDLLRVLLSTNTRRISAAGFLDTGMVLRRDATGQRQQRFEQLISTPRLSIVPVTEEQARVALEAFGRYGKGRGHPAGLNSAIALHTLWPKSPQSPFYSKATTSPGLTFRLPYDGVRAAEWLAHRSGAYGFCEIFDQLERGSRYTRA